MTFTGYGYDHDTQVEGIVNGYRKEGIPLDGMHLDVDFQVSSTGAVLVCWAQQNYNIFTGPIPHLHGKPEQISQS